MLRKQWGRGVEKTGNTVRIVDKAADVAAAISKANPTNKEIMIVLKAIWERGE
jgi:hypothetical protein